MKSGESKTSNKADTIDHCVQQVHIPNTKKTALTKKQHGHKYDAKTL